MADSEKGSDEDHDDTQFGIRTPPLLDYLQGILRGYSDGQILKELLQNAEDAGASQVQYLYDQRQYGRGRLFDKRLGVFQGPAICSYNNAVFRADDWKAIQTPSLSGKKENALKVGRFGIGFSSVYHITDLPFILSQQYLGIIDPFEEYFKDKGGYRASGLRRKLKDVLFDPRYQDQLEPLQASLPDGSEFTDDGTFSGTLFRFPLRQTPSKLSENVYTSETARILLEAFNEDARLVLLFLRHVESVAIYTRGPERPGKKILLDVSFEQSCLEELRTSREEFGTRLQEFKNDPTGNSRSIEMTNVLDLQTTQEQVTHREKWVIQHEIALDCSDELKCLFQKLNFLPWIGVAVPLFQKDGTDGRIFCFLPLPPGESFSGLPVHVHGFFGVTDDRRSIKWPGEDRIQNPEADWNKLLLDEILPGVYRKALLKSTEAMIVNDIAPSVVYAAFPDVRKDIGHWKDAIETLYSDLFEYPMLYCESEHEWMALQEVYLVPEDLAETPNLQRVVVKTLQDHGFSIVVEIPDHVREAVGQTDRFITPDMVIECLCRDTAFNNYSEEEKLWLLEYLLANNCTIDQLNGLSLLPTHSGDFVPFSVDPPPRDVVYMPTAECPQKLLPGIDHRFVRKLCGSLGEHLEAMCLNDDCKQLRFLDVDAVIMLLPQALPGSWCSADEGIEVWDPDKTGELNLEWLERFWNFISREQVDLKRLEGLKMIPVKFEEGVHMATVSPNSKIVHQTAQNETTDNLVELVNILMTLGVIFCTLPSYVARHHQSSDFVRKMNPNVILDILHDIGSGVIEEACSSSNDSQHRILSYLLPYLADASLTPWHKKFLRRLAVFSPIHGHFVALKSVDIIATKETKHALPNVRLYSRECVYIDGGGLYQLLAKLDCSVSKFEEVLGYILDDACQKRYAPDELQELISWIHSNYETIKRFPVLREKLQVVQFVPNEKNELKKPTELFDRSDEIVNKLILKKSLLPLESFFSDWQHILQDLFLKSQKDITSAQVIKVAQHIRDKKDKKRADALVRFLFRFPDHLSDKTHRDFMKSIPLLPCRQNPAYVYPHDFAFIDTKDKLFMPKDVVVYSEENCCLAGASVPLCETSELDANGNKMIHDKVIKRLGVRKKPNIGDVLRQLHQCVSHPDVDRNYWGMLHFIYSFLNESIEGNPEISLALPKKWIFLGDQFVESNRVYREEGSGTVDLRPYRCAIPGELAKYGDLLTAAKVPERVDEDVELLLDVLKEIPGSTETADAIRLRVCLNILRRLSELDVLEDEGIRQKLLIPTNRKPLTFLPPNQVCYCDTEWIRKGLDADDIQDEEGEDAIVLVHDLISTKMAEEFEVVPLSQRLAGASEIGYIRQTGQIEPLTVRLANILRDGYQPESIPKEMVQNAEDAGASEVKFLLDLRSNSSSMEKLLDPEMKAVQGPALWIYNDAVFSDKDLENITKLGGATKREDSLKIGQFGLGFNSVYHITDVPSFVTRNVITFFDPHRSYLRRQILGEGTGIQLNFLSNPTKIQRFRDQFAPFDGLFGCKILGGDSGPEYFNGTLFRLPLRSKAEAEKGKICDVSYDEVKMKPLMESLCDSASHMLLFNEKVKTISVYQIGADSTEPSLLYTTGKTLEHDDAEQESFKTAIVESNEILPDQVTTLTISSTWTDRGESYFWRSLLAQTSKEDTWITVSSMGKGRTRNLCESQIGRKSGLLPCGGVALCLTSATSGKIFSFLPISVPESGLPVCVNGAFALSSDRRGIWRETEHANMTPLASLKSKWNDALCEDIIVCAYVALLQQPTIKEYIGIDDAFILWPNPQRTGKNTDCGKVMTGFYKAVAHGMGRDDPPRVFGNTDGGLSITQVVFGDETVQKEAATFNLFRIIMEQISPKTVVRIPMWVDEGFRQAQCKSITDSITYSWERFFRDIFLPNFNLLEPKTISDMMTFALSLRDKSIHNLLQGSKCIPSICEQGIMYKKPCDLLDPGYFRCIFSENDGVFPEPSFLSSLDEGQMGVLREIGCLRRDIEWETVIERVEKIENMWIINKSEAKKRIIAILNFMDSKMKVTTNSISEPIRNQLKSTLFIPATKHDQDERIQCAEKVYPTDKTNLIGRVRYIVSIDIPLSVKRLLGIDVKDVTPDDVFENIGKIKRSLDGPVSEAIRGQWDSVYSYLESQLTNAKVINFVQTEKVFLVEQTFVEAGKLAWRSESIPPYLYQVPNHLFKFINLLNAAGVVSKFGYKEFLNVLESIVEDHVGEPLEEMKLQNVLAKIIKPLFDMADEIPNDVIPTIPMPDSNKVLHPSDSLSFCDLEQFEHLTSTYKLCHAEIPLPHAKRLGVRDIRDQMLKEYSQPLPGLSLGEDFGQKEELVTRIRRIMEGYPCDFSILKEIVQNADDAKATKVHFVLDCRTHPKERLFYDAMKELQGPALLAYNDSPFSDDDIRGIQKLGEGSKGEDSDKTGRYGVGFNVVYHLTDCPMFMSEERTLCIFDPTLRYVKDANAMSPGRMFRPINDHMLQSYADIFEDFLSFKDTFSLKSGSLFRFALRTHDSELGPKISVENVKCLFESFKQEMFDVLLFLKSVEQITVSTWNNDGCVPEETYTVKSTLPEQDKEARRLFFQSVSKQKDVPISEIVNDSIQYQTEITDNLDYRENWLIHQRLGMQNKDKVPKSVRRANTSSNLKLIPKGGVAARLNTARNGPSRQKPRTFHGKCFCFLPLPIESNLPVHVDGYFSLGHESRRNLWEAPEGDVKSDWNVVIAKEVIAPAYVGIMKKVRDDVTQRTQDETEAKKLAEQLKQYHSYFPVVSQTKQAGHRSVLEEVCQSFYLQIFENALRLFPVALPDGRSDDKRSCGNNLTLSWKSCRSDAMERGYFDTLYKQVGIYELEALRDVLLKLGLPILKTPIKILNAMSSFLGEEDSKNILTVTPKSVMEFLKTDAKKLNILELPMPLKDTVIGDDKCLGKLISYILRFNEGQENKKVEMNDLPLLLTSDGILREFNTSTPVFHSKFACLLPKHKSEFLHETFLHTLDADDDCFRKLTIMDLLERLSSHLSEEEFCQADYRLLPQDCATDPSDKWLVALWEFLYECYHEDNEVDIQQMFGNWCVFPARLNDQSALVPMNLAKTVLSSRISSYHTQMQNILTKLHVPVARTDILGEVEILCDFVNRFASDIETTQDVLRVLERLLKFKKDGFRALEKEEHNSILQYISTQVSQLKDHELGIIKRLPCFETIDGKHVDLSTTAYTVSMDHFPQTEQDKWVSMSPCILLKKTSVSEDILRFLKVGELDIIKLYDRFILPFFERFAIQAQWDHLNQVMKIVDNADNSEDVINSLQLKTRRLIARQDGTLMRTDYFRDPENPVYAIMTEAVQIPPDHPNPSKQSSWLRFLRQIGMQSVVTCEEFRGFLESVKNDSQSNVEREKILVDYLLSNHQLHVDKRFLREVFSIAFITGETVRVNLRELHEQCSDKKVSMSGISVTYCRLVWTTKPLLPAWANIKLALTCGQCGHPLRKKLQVTNEPTMLPVLSHTQKIFTLFSSSRSTRSHAQSIGAENQVLLEEVIKAILGFLSGQCQNRGEPDKCLKLENCCDNCTIIVNTLRDISIIPMSNGVFFKASGLTQNLNMKENDKLFTFIRKIPYCVMSYYKLLCCMGATEQPSLYQYACALGEMTRLGSSLEPNPTMYQAAEQAMEGIFRRLAEGDISELSAISRLYLLSKKKQLVNSTNLFINNEPTFAKRLSEFPHPFMKDLTSLGIQFSDKNIEELVGKLAHLKPSLISDHVVEVSVGTDESQISHNCHCSRSQQIRKVLGWSSFTEAVKCILHNQGVKDFTDHESALRTVFKVICLPEIQTELQIKGGMVMRKSRRDKGVLLKTTGDHQATVFLSHKCKDLIDIQITRAFRSFFGILALDMGGMSAVFKTRSEKDLFANLSQLGLKTKDSEFDDYTPPVPGSDIEEDVICLLLENFLADFSPEEYVGYNIARSENEHFVYARIIRRVQTDETVGIAHQYKVKYLIDAGEEIEVDAVWLYRFQCPDDVSVTTRLPHYNANAPPSSSREVELYAGDTDKDRKTDQDFSDLGKTKREITALIEALWKEDENTRNTGLRRLMRRWHPDKNNAEHKQFAEEIFKHIRSEIARLGNGIPSGIDSESDIFRWATQNNRQQSNYWRRHQRRNRGRGSRGRRAGGGFCPPPSFHRFNQEASRWQKQARVDLNAASQVAERADFYQWKCSLCFFAAEKAVRAAQFVCGCEIDEDHNIMDAAIQLEDDLDVTQEVNQLSALVEKSSHYPKAQSSSIPHEQFDDEQANMVMDTVIGLLRKIDDYIRVNSL